MNIPLIGLGTYQVKGHECTETVINALRLGYRLIDTARCYKNEKDVGTAIKESGIPRKDIFITSKIAPTEHGEESAHECVIDTLVNLQTSYLDLMLIHWPGASKKLPSSEENKQLRRASWKGLMRAKNEGLVKYIGVSNFMISHLDDFINTYPCEIPYLNQVECHPLCNQHELRDYCQSHGILFQAYSSLGQASEMLLHHPLITSLSLKYNISSTELLLLWAIQQSPPIYVIPKARSVCHMERNLLFPWKQYFINSAINNTNDDTSSNSNSKPQIQQSHSLLSSSQHKNVEHSSSSSSLLSQEDMQLLNSIDINHHFCWDPNTVM